MKIPSTTKEWVRDVKEALNEALSIHEEGLGKESEVPRNDIYKMASSIGLIYRDIDDESLKDELIKKTWSNILYIHKEIPHFQNKYKRCFVHAYLDSMIHLGFIKVNRSEKIIDILERQGKIEHHLPDNT